jgi:AcrR family transcriptional regulator
MIVFRLVAPRRYEQRVRAEAAEETRRRIIETVIEHLRTAPTEPVSVERIAAEADVARSTVYAIFGSRAGLFRAVATEIYERSGYAQLIEAVQHPDAREHLHGGLRAGTEMVAANRDIVRVLFSTAHLDEEAGGGAMRRLDLERAAGMARLARRLDEQGLLRPDVSVEEAEHILWVLTSFETFDLLYTGRGLSTDAVSDMLIAMAERSILCT